MWEPTEAITTVSNSNVNRFYRKKGDDEKERQLAQDHDPLAREDPVEARGVNLQGDLAKAAQDGEPAGRQ